MHFTYCEHLSPTELYQGDILKRTPELEGILSEFFPYYKSKSDYNYFIVITQSCDLVQRDGRCKAPYVSLSPVRPVSRAIELELNKLLQSDLEKKFRFTERSRKDKLILFIERLLNNNEIDYFFLNREPEHGLGDNYCAFLRLTVAIKSIHFEALLKSKILQLDESFQHKLGFNIGTSYARVGTKDWVPTKFEKESDFHIHSNQLAESIECNFIDKKVHTQIVKKYSGVDLSTIDIDRFTADITEIAKTIKNKGIEVERILIDVAKNLSVDDLTAKKMAAALRQRPDFLALLK